MKMSKSVAIIGSGASGLAAIKCCLDEGLTPVCFERTDHIGGLWYFTKDVKDGQSCVMKTTVINTSKEFMAYSDFPIPAEFPMYMHNTKVIEYFEMYAKHINAEKYIQFNTEVTKVQLTEDFDKTGQWVLTILDSKGNSRKEVFDGVMVCSGHHADKNIPTFEGLDTFQGHVTHTHDYRDHVGYEDKKVMVIGIGNSGGDVAVELSRIAKQVYISTRRGAWVFNRINDNGMPGDLTAISRFTDFLRRSVLPASVMSSLAESKLNRRFDHANYGLRPKHRVFATHPTLNDELPNRIASGTVLIKPDIRKFTSTGVEFLDGSTAELDAVILATGYIFGFPFIDHPALEVKKNHVNLYKYVFPPDIRPGTLAVIGCIQPLGAIMPISELQCRWAARVFNKAAHLPSPKEMREDMAKKEVAMRARYVDSMRHTIQVDYLPYMDDIGSEIGIIPDIGALLWKDPVLALRCFFGPFTPYQYRLQGPGQWSGAREAIMTVWERTLTGINPSKQGQGQQAADRSVIMYVVAAVIFAILLKWILL